MNDTTAVSDVIAILLDPAGWAGTGTRRFAWARGPDSARTDSQRAHDADSLRSDDLRYDAVERCLERIREVAFRLGDQADELISQQPWRANRGLGDCLRHG